MYPVSWPEENHSSWTSLGLRPTLYMKVHLRKCQDFRDQILLLFLYASRILFPGVLHLGPADILPNVKMLWGFPEDSSMFSIIPGSAH